MPQQKIEKVYLVIYKSIANTQAVEVFRQEWAFNMQEAEPVPE